MEWLSGATWRGTEALTPEHELHSNSHKGHPHREARLARSLRLPVLWLAFCALFLFWLTALCFHLGGGLTTYWLLVIALALLVRTARVSRRV